MTIALHDLKLGLKMLVVGNYSLYPKTVELLLDELCMAERSVLIHETMMLNNANGSDLPLRMPGSQEQRYYEHPP